MTTQTLSEAAGHLPPEAGGTIVHLRGAGVSLVLDCRRGGLPVVAHWGADLGDVDRAVLESVALTRAAPAVASTPDAPRPVGILPEHAAGWSGLPGLRGHRDGRDWSAAFEVTSLRTTGPDPGAGGRVEVEAVDTAAHLGLGLRVELTASGLVQLQATVRNTHPTAAYTVDGLVLALPVPAVADELLDLSGRWARERSPQRSPFHAGTRLRDGRRGRTGADATLTLVAGRHGFGFRSGEVWGVHVGWSGNHRTYAERTPNGESVLGGGELLLSGEIRLAPGESYTSPVVHGSHGDGLDAMAHRFHDHLRSRPNHPTSPRPVVANTWEAVYFDHDLGRLTTLADAAAEVGAERFVLDDGWFRRRTDDHAGLGDWYVDEERWPAGLHPLVDHVRALGMEFGLWFEPEMVNPDSDLARAHPEWILATGGRMPPESRFQQVLDLGNSEAWQYLFERISALVGEYGIGYLKWDHNRDLVDAGHQPDGTAGVHEQTLAVYRLMAALKAAHPGLEIESCSSGGARVDLGVLEHTDRVWTSDCIDALERQSIQRWTGLLLPLELMGSHVGSGHSHTTGRRHDLAFRAGTALFGHFGIEWDLTEAGPQERAELAAWVAAYKRLRPLLHSGTVVRSDHDDPAVWVHGVVAADRAEAVFSVVQMATSNRYPHGRVQIPGLSPDTTYDVRPLEPGHAPPTTESVPTPWLATGLTLTGRALDRVGVPVPAMHPDQLLLLHIREVTS